MVELVFTVNPGIEDIVSREAYGVFGGGVSRYSMLSGRVYYSVDGSIDYLFERILELKTINKAMLHIATLEIEPSYSFLGVLKNRLPRVLEGIVEFIGPGTSFAVTTERIGVHEYTSVDLARVIGDAVIEVVKEFYGRRPRVDLRNPSVIVHGFARENELIIGVLLSGPWSMHRRGYRVYDHPAALKSTLAVAMLYISGARDRQVIVDPMCGGGTIPIEAALLYEDAAVYGFDINPLHIRGALMNAVAAGVVEKIVFRVWDARKIHEVIGEVDHMILNPPYGIRYGDPWSIRRLYREFLESAEKALRDRGRITMITTEYTYVHKVVKNTRLNIVHERIVQHGGLYPHIILLEKM